MKFLKIIIISILFLSITLLLDKQFPINLTRYQNQSPILLDKNNELLVVLIAKDGRYRFPVRLHEIDPGFLKMLIAFEDKRFYYHFGVDPIALMRAVGQWMVSGKPISGASTLTLQTIRLLEPRQRTLKNKFIEFIKALQLECHYSKKEILEMYLTLTPYGGNLEGIRTATYAYFGKEARHLTVAEAALLIALPQQPTRLRPDIHPGKAHFHRNKVIQRMQQTQTLNNQQILEAMQDKLVVKKNTFPKIAPHLIYNLVQHSPNTFVFNSSLDKSIQLKIENLLLQLKSTLDPSQSMASMVVNNKTKQIVAYVGSSDFLDEKRCGQVDMIRAIRSPGSTLKPFIYAMGFEEGIIEPEMTINDIPTAFRGYAPRNFKDIFHGTVTIKEALQQSLNVPAVAILEKIGPGMFAARLRDLGIILKFERDTISPTLPIALGGVGMRLCDLVSLYVALANHGEFNELQFLKNNDSAQDKECSNILYKNDLVDKNIYQVSKNDSVEKKIIPLSKRESIVKNNSTEKNDYPLYKRGSTPPGVGGIFSDQSVDRQPKTKEELNKKSNEKLNKELVQPTSAYLVNQILQETPAPEGFIDWRMTHEVPIAYKTGTSYGYRDAWAIGFTPDYTIGIWVGKPDGTPSYNLTGRTNAAPILFKIASFLPIENYTMPIPMSPQHKLVSDIKETNINNFKAPKEVNHKEVKQKEAAKKEIAKNEITKKESFNKIKTHPNLKILFPIDGSIIHSDSKTLQISISGGDGPYYLLENGEPVTGNFQNKKIMWKPKTAGFIELTIIDSNGNGDTVNIKFN